MTKENKKRCATCECYDCDCNEGSCHCPHEEQEDEVQGAPI